MERKITKQGAHREQALGACMNNWGTMERKRVGKGLQSPTVRSCRGNGITHPSIKAQDPALGWQPHLGMGVCRAKKYQGMRYKTHTRRCVHKSTKRRLSQGPVAPSRAEPALLKVIHSAPENRVFQLKGNIMAMISSACPSPDMDYAENIS